jgi:hypothetical protein
MYVRPASPQSVGGVLDDAIKLYRASFRACWPVAAAAAVIMGAIGAYLALHLLDTGIVNAATAMQFLNVYRQPGVQLAYVADAAARIAAYGAILIYQNALADGESEPSMQESLSVMLGRLIPGLIASLVWWVVIVVGFALLLIPGIYLLGALCLWPVCLFAGKAGPLASLGQSRDLIRGHWWRTTTILTVATILVLVLSAVAGGVIGGVVGIFRRDMVVMQLAIQCVAVVVSVFTLPAIPAALVAVYRDLKLRREGSDLAARLGALPRG